MRAYYPSVGLKAPVAFLSLRVICIVGSLVVKQGWPRRRGHAVEFAAVARSQPACRFEASTLHPRPRSLQRITYAHTEMSFDLIVRLKYPTAHIFLRNHDYGKSWEAGSFSGVVSEL